jgi:hypothetical protein
MKDRTQMDGYWKYLRDIHVENMKGGPDERLHGFLLLDLHDRMSAFEQLEVDTEDNIDELLEHTKDQLAMRAYSLSHSHKIMTKMWKTEQRKRMKLEAQVAEFVKWAMDNGIQNIKGKLQELGLLEAGGQGDAMHPDNEANSED